MSKIDPIYDYENELIAADNARKARKLEEEKEIRQSDKVMRALERERRAFHKQVLKEWVEKADALDAADPWSERF